MKVRWIAVVVQLVTLIPVFQNMLSREEKFDVSTLTFFRVFFSDRSNFIRKYHEKRGDKGMECTVLVK